MVMFWAILESFSDACSPCQLSGRLPSLVGLRRGNTRHCQPTWDSKYFQSLSFDTDNLPCRGNLWVLSQSTMISSPALSINPACGSVGTKNVALCVLSKKIWGYFFLYNSATNLDNKDGGPVVADPWGHLGQAFVVWGGRVQETPVLSVLKQKVGVDEQDAGELKFLIKLEII